MKIVMMHGAVSVADDKCNAKYKTGFTFAIRDCETDEQLVREKEYIGRIAECILIQCGQRLIGDTITVEFNDTRFDTEQKCTSLDLYPPYNKVSYAVYAQQLKHWVRVQIDERLAEMHRAEQCEDDVDDDNDYLRSL